MTFLGNFLRKSVILASHPAFLSLSYLFRKMGRSIPVFQGFLLRMRQNNTKASRLVLTVLPWGKHYLLHGLHEEAGAREQRQLPR